MQLRRLTEVPKLPGRFPRVKAPLASGKRLWLVSAAVAPRPTRRRSTLLRFAAVLAATAGLALANSSSALADAYGTQLQITNQGPPGAIGYVSVLPAVAYNSRAG